MARAIYDTDKPRGEELRSWLFDGRMSASQLARIGRSDKPPCFASEAQWISWCIHEAARPILGGSSYCYDCTREFQQAKNRNGDCEHPLTTFRSVGHPPVLVGQRDRRRAPPR
jgi:hypothetical protein